MSGQKTAGGMSYQTWEDIDYRIIEYLSRHDGMSSEIFEKNKEYYLASAGKTMARLILAKTRITYLKLQEKEAFLINEKISNGIGWLKSLKKNIKNAENNLEFKKAVSYKEWHAVKLIPSAAEGYAISLMMEDKVKKSANKYAKKLKDANLHIKEAKKIFFKQLNSTNNTNFKLAEKQRIKAYKELNLAFKIVSNK